MAKASLGPPSNIIQHCTLFPSSHPDASWFFRVLFPESLLGNHSRQCLEVVGDVFALEVLDEREVPYSKSLLYDDEHQERIAVVSKLFVLS